VLGTRRELLAWTLTLVGLPALTWTLLNAVDSQPLHITLFAYLLTAVVVAALGGVRPAAMSAVGGFLLANWYFTTPRRTWSIAHADDVFSLLTFLVVSLAVGYLVGEAARRSAEANRARLQAEALAATSALAASSLRAGLQGIAERIRDAFSAAAVGILTRKNGGWETLAFAGTGGFVDPVSAEEAIELAEGLVLVLNAGRLSADDRRVLRTFATQATQAIERVALEREAGTAAAMAETDRLRTALLRAVSHDLRTPLSAIKASVTSLLETGVEWSPEHQHEFLETILEETERLNRLVSQLLDASRVQAGAIPVSLSDVSLDEVVQTAVGSLRPNRNRVEMNVPDAILVRVDGALLERSIANVVENAMNWSPSDSRVLVTAQAAGGKVLLRVSDRGPGIPDHLREAIFQPFQRTGDAPRGGVGLGLAVARGFVEAMGGELTVDERAGSGTTMLITLVAVRSAFPSSVIGQAER
jgi:two-component system sensor histidine kinase KdpD